MLKELASLLCSLFVPRKSVSGGGIIETLFSLLEKEKSYA